MQSFPQPLSAAQETVYLRQYQNGDMHARDILIERNLRLVAHIVKKYQANVEEAEDLLYDPIGTDKEGNEITLLSILEHEDEDIIDQLDKKQSLRKLSKILSKVLTPREYFVVIRRYGLYGHHETTQRELAEQLNISRSYVSRIEKKALEKLRLQLN